MALQMLLHAIVSATSMNAPVQGHVEHAGPNGPSSLTEHLNAEQAGVHCLARLPNRPPKKFNDSTSPQHTHTHLLLRLWSLFYGPPDTLHGMGKEAGVSAN